MRVLVAGCWRSGTTALYNLVRLILESDGQTLSCFEDDYFKYSDLEFTHELLKAHKFKSNEVKHGISLVDWPDYIITIFREPGETLDSMRRFYREESEKEIQERLARGLSYWGKYQFYADYQANYDQLFRSTEKLAREIASVLGIEIDEKAIVRAFRQIEPPKEGYDKITLLHANHITNK